jgi:hypothetical protein
MTRPPSPLEQDVILKLLSLDFVGSKELVEQLDDLTVWQVDENGSLLMEVGSPINAIGIDGVVAEAIYRDLDTSESNPIRVNILLHVKQGRLWMLEIYKDDGSRIGKKPIPEEFALFTRLPKSRTS